MIGTVVVGGDDLIGLLIVLLIAVLIIAVIRHL